MEKIHKNSRTAAQILLEKAHIATIPGSVFGAQGEGHLRFGYAITIKEIEDCVEALRKFLRLAPLSLLRFADGAAGFNARGAQQPRNLLQVQLHRVGAQNLSLRELEACVPHLGHARFKLRDVFLEVQILGGGTWNRQPWMQPAR